MSNDSLAPDNAPALDPALLERVRKELAQGDAFQSDATLRDLFADPRLQPWANRVPASRTVAERVDGAIALLLPRSHTDGQPALVLLLEAVRSRVDPGDAQHGALATLGERVATSLSGARLKPPPRRKVEKAPGESPFKGLHYYDVEDAADFFGREALTATLWQLLLEPEPPSRQIALVGPSGSGKTSLLRAGLVPRLAQEEGWLHYLMTPTAQPLQKLAAAVTPESQSLRAAATLVDDLLQEPRSLALHAHQLLSQNGAERLLLMVDHFEELFTLCTDEAARRAFVDNVLAASADGPLTLLIALDSAYVTAVEKVDGLQPLLERRVVSIGRMTEAELEQSITEPARRGGWTFEQGLVERIIEDVGDEPGALPLLSQALHATWARREGRTLTHAGYQAAGEVDGAVAKTADDLYRALPEEMQTVARALCLRLVIPRGAGRSQRLPSDARARVQREELFSTAHERETVEEVVKRLAREHLLIVEGDVVALAQDTLLEEWERLRGWVDAERKRLREHYRLALDARRWQEQDKDESLTYRGNALARAERYADAPVLPLSHLEAAFLHESRRAQVRRMRRERERQQRTRRSALGAAVGGALGMGFTILPIYGTLIEDNQSLLLFITVVDALLGAVAGVALILLVDLALSGAAEEEEGQKAPRWPSWLMAAAAGAVVLALLLVGHGLFTTQWPYTWGKVLGVIVEGGMWGAGVGVGRAWLRHGRRPLWQTSLSLILAWALLLFLGDQVGQAYSFPGGAAGGLAVAAAGAVVPLFMLGGAEVAAKALFPRRRAVSAEGLL